MGLFRRRKPADHRTRAERRAETESSKADLEEFLSSRIGVEAYLEPATVLDRLSVLLVAGDGESTRRRVPDEAWARKWAASVQVPFFRAEVSGYPQRLREYTRRQKLRPEERSTTLDDGGVSAATPTPPWSDPQPWSDQPPWPNQK